MDKFLEIVGAIGVIAVLLIMAVVLVNSAGSTRTIMLAAMLPWALPAIVGSVVIAAFGSMLGHLKAIRELLERQEYKSFNRSPNEGLDDFRAR